MRILLDDIAGHYYHQSTVELFYYYFSFAFIPFIVASSFKMNENYIMVIRQALTISGVLFAALSIFSYQQFIGTVGRLSTNTTSQEEVISPLILSYCSTLAIGVSISYVFYNKTTFLEKAISIATVALSIIPFFLGASRGALVALFIPFLLMIFSRRSAMFIFKSTIIFILAIVAIVALDQYLGSGLLTRFSSLSTDIQEENSSAVRVVMWRNSFDQFQDSPLWGDKLAVNGFGGYYPHNIILEVLQSTGIIGFIPFIIVLFYSTKVAFKLFRDHQKYSWLGIVFLQSFFQNMFSGAVYTASWLWFSMALLFSVDQYLKNQNKM